MAKRKQSSSKETTGKAESTCEVEFQLLEPHARHHEGLRLQLVNWCRWWQVEVFDVADAIVEQVNIGSLLAIPDEPLHGSQAVDTCVVGVVTLLNVEQHEKLLGKACQRVARLCRKEAPKLANILEEGAAGKRCVGMLIDCRVNGLPSSVVGGALQSIKEDITWSLAQADCPADERAFYRFEYVVGSVPLYKVESTIGEPGRKKAQKQADAAEWVYPVPEAKVLLHLCDKTEQTILPTDQREVGDDNSTSFHRYQLLFALKFADLPKLAAALASQD